MRSHRNGQLTGRWRECVNFGGKCKPVCASMTLAIFGSNPKANYNKITRINKNLKLDVLNYIDDEKPRVLLSPTILDGCQFNEALTEVFI